ncbi:MAG: trypsin-like peptidase domain-containing protein [Oscillospiraceae bacterium]|nr:trypsin-like peptidase domain-containing protein [Oscillospiraceae bacterium]
MRERNRDPWDPSIYQTGDTQPPKRKGSCLMLLAVAVVLFGGIATVLSFLGVSLFGMRPDSEESAPVSFVAEESQAPTEATTAPTAAGGEHALELNQSPQAVENVPQEGGLSLQEIYEKAINSVVSITSDVGTGTGVVVNKDGYIVTNAHVIAGATAIEVLLTDGRMVAATLVGADGVSDLAVLHVQATDLAPAEFGNSESVRVGDAVVAIGDPLGIELRGTMTNGIVSAINRDITTGGRTMTLIQTNAALNSGNSGGPLLNCYGQVIGINTMKIGDNMNTVGVEGLGFAIPSTTVKEVVDQLMHQGYVSGRPGLGLEAQALSPFDRMYYRLPQGLYITAVETGSDAADKGILPGDVLLALDGTYLTAVEDLQSALYSYNAGDMVRLTIYRNGSQYYVDVVLSEAR